MKTTPKVQYPDMYKLHKLQNKEYTSKCLAVPESVLEKVPKSGSSEGVVRFGIDIYNEDGKTMELKNCDGSGENGQSSETTPRANYACYLLNFFIAEQGWEILTFRAPRLIGWEKEKKLAREEVDLTKRQSMAVGEVSRSEERIDWCTDSHLKFFSLIARCSLRSSVPSTLRGLF